jgi:hypothetical protein
LNSIDHYRSARSVDLIRFTVEVFANGTLLFEQGQYSAKSPISRYVRIGRVALGTIARKVSSSRQHVLQEEQRAVVDAGRLRQ